MRPQLVVCQPDDHTFCVLIQLYPASQDLMTVLPDKQWKASPVTYMTELLRNTGTRLGLITNGRAWMLLDAPDGVDKNPMAVERAKLSLWLIIIARNRPFTFIDHALCSGDSLLR